MLFETAIQTLKLLKMKKLSQLESDYSLLDFINILLDVINQSPIEPDVKYQQFK